MRRQEKLREISMGQPRLASQRRGHWGILEWGEGLNYTANKGKNKASPDSVELTGPGTCLQTKGHQGSNFSAAYYLQELAQWLILSVSQCFHLSNRPNIGTHLVGLLSNALVHVKCWVSSFSVHSINTLVNTFGANKVMSFWEWVAFLLFKYLRECDF